MTNMYEKFYPKYNFLEICLILFDRCNLGCKFCFQGHTSLKTPDEIKNIYIDFLPQLETALSHRPWIKKLVFRVWGGEVFMDVLEDEYLTAYKFLQNKITEWAQERNYEIEFNYSSNLVFNKILRVQNFLKDTNSGISTSYDPVERFRTQELEDIWWKNIEIFKPKVISITLTKLNIEKYIQSNILLKLKDYTLYPEYYIYNKDWKKYAPTGDDVFNFYKYYYNSGLNNIPEFEALIDSYEHPNGRYCVCSNSCSYINNKLTFSCLMRSGTLSMLADYGMTLEDCLSDKCTEIQYTLATNRLKCQLCKHYSYCRLPCMASQLHKNTDKQCALNKFYNWMDENE